MSSKASWCVVCAWNECLVLCVVVCCVVLCGCWCWCAMCVCCACVSVWCVARLGTRKIKPCTSKTPPCVLSKRPHVFNMQAFCRCTRRRFERTHGGVLLPLSFALLSHSLSFSSFLISIFQFLLLLLFPWSPRSNHFLVFFYLTQK